MLEFFSQFSEEAKLFILKTVGITGAVIIVAVVLFSLMNKLIRMIKGETKKLEKQEREMEKHEIDMCRVGECTRSDLHFWIRNNMKKHCHCLVMTKEVAWNKDHDIKFPSTGSEWVLYLCIYRLDSQKVVNRYFIVADSLEPELDDLLKEHNGSVDFEY